MILQKLFVNKIALCIGAIVIIFLYVGYLNYKNTLLNNKIITIRNTADAAVNTANDNTLKIKANALANKNILMNTLNKETVKNINKETALRKSVDNLPSNSYRLNANELAILESIGNDENDK